MLELHDGRRNRAPAVEERLDLVRAEAQLVEEHHKIGQDQRPGDDRRNGESDGPVAQAPHGVLLPSRRYSCGMSGPHRQLLVPDGRSSRDVSSSARRMRRA